MQLMELRNIGYHWLSDFLQAVLNGTVHADHLAYEDHLPRPVAELQQRCAAELEMILASSRHGLPFHTAS